MGFFERDFGDEFYFFRLVVVFFGGLKEFVEEYWGYLYIREGVTVRLYGADVGF